MGQVKLDLPGDALTAADTLRLEFAHPDGMNIATYDLQLRKPADTTPKIDAKNLAGVHFQAFPSHHGNTGEAAPSAGEPSSVTRPSSKKSR